MNGFVEFLPLAYLIGFIFPVCLYVLIKIVDKDVDKLRKEVEELKKQVST